MKAQGLVVTQGKIKLNFVIDIADAAAAVTLVERLRARATNAGVPHHVFSERHVAKAGRFLEGEATFPSDVSRESFRSWLRSELPADVLRRARISWHLCAEDEPEPVHLPYEHPDYQEWRASRDCRERSFGEEVQGDG